MQQLLYTLKTFSLNGVKLVYTCNIYKNWVCVLFVCLCVYIQYIWIKTFFSIAKIWGPFTDPDWKLGISII